MGSDAPESRPSVETLDVITTRFNLRRMRLGQLLVPLAAIVSPFARRSMSPVALLATVLLMGGALWAFVTARTRRSATIAVRRGRLHLDGQSIPAGDEAKWRWHGKRATLFLATGNVVVRPRVPIQAELLHAKLRASLGDPLTFKRRGSPRARFVAGSALALGLVLTIVGFAFDSFVAVVGLVMIIFGGAALGALSQAVFAPLSKPSPNQRG